jgi:hypothetical protein
MAVEPAAKAARKCFEGFAVLGELFLELADQTTPAPSFDAAMVGERVPTELARACRKLIDRVATAIRSAQQEEATLRSLVRKFMEESSPMNGEGNGLECGFHGPPCAKAKPQADRPCTACQIRTLMDAVPELAEKESEWQAVLDMIEESQYGCDLAGGKMGCGFAELVDDIRKRAIQEGANP